MSAYNLNNINYIPVAGGLVELSASTMTPIVNDSHRVYPDDTNVTVSESSDADTFKLEDENSTNTSVKMKSLILVAVLFSNAWLLSNQFELHIALYSIMFK